MRLNLLHPALLLSAAALLVGCGGGDGGHTGPAPSLPSDMSLHGQVPFPADNAWNMDVSQESVDPSSATLIASCGTGSALHPDFGTVYDGAPIGIPYVLIPGTQATVPVTCPHTRKGYVAPARHYASSDTRTSLPPMGMRVRLKASVDISHFPAHVRVILTALQHYGMFLADNGSAFYVSGAPDARWDDDELHTLQQLHGSDFEVVHMGTVVTQ